CHAVVILARVLSACDTSSGGLSHTFAPRHASSGVSSLGPAPRGGSCLCFRVSRLRGRAIRRRPAVAVPPGVPRTLIRVAGLRGGAVDAPCAVHLLDLIDEVGLDRLATEDVEQLLRADRAFGDLLPGLDLLTARNVDPRAVRDGVLSPFLVHAPDHDLVALHA